MFSLDDEQEFVRLFRSNDSAYGTTETEDFQDGKLQSRSKLVHEPVAFAVVSKHLHGDQSIGLSPLCQGNTVNWCAIDVDNPEYDIMTTVDAIYEFDLPVVPVYSKSKHLHLYFFFEASEPAENAVAYVKQYLPMFRLPQNTEVFPKQTRITSSTRFPSWINLPYYNASDMNNWRKGIKRDGTLMDLSTFVQIAREKALSLDEHIGRLEHTPYYGAPPCIQSGAILRDIPQGMRNMWMYNVACYLRMDDEEAEIEEPLLELNNTMRNPLPEREVRTTVAKVASRTYYYQCSGMCGCDKAACKRTANGIGSDKSSRFNYGTLTKYLTDPIQWNWEINGQTLRFASTEQFLNQSTFQKLCVEKLNQCPYIVAKDKWTSIVSRALDNVVEIKVDVFAELGTGSDMLRAVATWIAGRNNWTDNRDGIMRGSVQKTESEYLFNVSDLMMSVQDTLNTKFNGGEFRIKMQELGAHSVDGVVWAMPITSLPAPQAMKPIEIKPQEIMDDHGIAF